MFRVIEQDLLILQKSIFLFKNKKEEKLVWIII